MDEQSFIALSTANALSAQLPCAFDPKDFISIRGGMRKWLPGTVDLIEDAGLDWSGDIADMREVSRKMGLPVLEAGLGASCASQTRATSGGRGAGRPEDKLLFHVKALRPYLTGCQCCS